MHHTTQHQLPRSVVLAATVVEAAGNILETTAQPTGVNLNPLLTNGGNLFTMTLDSTGAAGAITVVVLAQVTPGGAWSQVMTYVHGANTVVTTDRTINAWAVRVTLAAAVNPTTLASFELRIARVGA